MKDYEENGYIEAKMIVDEAYGELIMQERHHIPWDKYEKFIQATAILLNASKYLDEQIAEYLRGIY